MARSQIQLGCSSDDNSSYITPPPPLGSAPATLVYPESLFLNLKIMKSVAAILLLYPSAAWAANHMVTVGAGGFVFNPNTITAAVGDTVEFMFTGVLRNTPLILRCKSC